MAAVMLLCAGIVLIIAEIFFGSFFLLFIGCGFCITAAIEYIIGFDTFGKAIAYQALSVCLFSAIALVTLRPKIKSWFKDSQVYEDTLCDGGVGEVKQGMVYFKGTLWDYESTYPLKDGDKVKILEIKNNKAIIES